MHHFRDTSAITYALIWCTILAPYPIGLHYAVLCLLSYVLYKSIQLGYTVSVYT